MPSSLPTLMVVAGLLQHANTLLICQRRRGAAFELKWEFPGGKVEPGETPAEGLRRELREELGIDAEIGAERYRTRHHYAGKYIVELIFYDAMIAAGDLLEHELITPAERLEGDAELIQWLSQNALPPS